jgi:hypothetical protein
LALAGESTGEVEAAASVMAEEVITRAEGHDPRGKEAARASVLPDGEEGRSIVLEVCNGLRRSDIVPSSGTTLS